MKYIIYLLSIFVLLACNNEDSKVRFLQKQVDSLKNQLAKSYKPGFGEFMSNIQAHHAKLWFAGKNRNWKLADFEIHEIKENLDDIRIYETERKESELINMIDPPLDSVNTAIQKHDPERFKSSFIQLTYTCNKCHQAAQFEFNVVKIPDRQMFSNQVFKPEN